MTASRIQELTIQDFRSIRGRITLPMDAPVVLIHGSNGIGKTSVLSALELAMTGDVAQHRRIEADYLAHAVNRAATNANVEVTASGVPGGGGHAALAISDGRISGSPLLDPELSRAYGERCYLAQSALSRLLEIYVSGDDGAGSPLTRFVNELLGLDRLDALIDGLYPLGHVARIRRLVPEYADAEAQRDRIHAEITEGDRALEAVRTQLADHAARLRSDLESIAVQIPNDSRVEDLVDASQRVARPQDVIQLRGWLEDVRTAASRFSSVQSSGDADAIALEDAWASARTLADAHRTSTLDEFYRVVEGLRSHLPDLPSPFVNDPISTFDGVSTRVEAALREALGRIAQGHELERSISEADASMARTTGRLNAIESQIASEVDQTEFGALAETLSALLPHVDAETCPVCDRDFREASNQPLAAHLSNKISRLVEHAGSLQALAAERLQLRTALDRDSERRRALAELLPDSEVQISLQVRVSDLTTAASALQRLGPLVKVASGYIREEAAVAQTVAELRRAASVASEVADVLNKVALQSGYQALDARESIPEALARFDTHFSVSIEKSRFLEATSSKIGESVEGIRNLLARSAELSVSVEGSRASLRSVAARLGAAEDRRDVGRRIETAAERARSAVIAEVFNNTLNDRWRELFIRLAPTELYVPAFKLPTAGERFTQAELITRHRDGTLGGAPGIMLSSGNLNTAALTLFLALHLSVEPVLPWLILDDPVQSMDEVHVSQLAALLRQLSKVSDRQVVIAVHERELFDYLCLELSPAFEGDRLIAIELGRSWDGISTAERDVRRWTPDGALSA